MYHFLAFVFEDILRVSLKSVNSMLQNKRVTILFETTIERNENSIPSGNPSTLDTPPSHVLFFTDTCLDYFTQPLSNVLSHCLLFASFFL